MAISVIIPAYNAAATLAAAVNSAVASSRDGGEVIIVDDGSTDDTYRVALDLQRQNLDLVKVIQQSNRGSSAARNAGMDIASRPYQMFLDADDCLLPDGVRDLLRLGMERRAEMIIGLAIVKRAGGVVEQDADHFRGATDLERFVRSWWGVSTVLIKNGKLRWRDDMQIWEVTEFFARHLLIGCSVAYSESFVTVLDERHSEARVTHRFDHYEPLRMAMFFNRLKRDAETFGKCDPGFASAVDRFVLGSLYQAVRQGASIRDIERKIVFHPDILATYEWYRSLNMAGFCRLFGIGLGLKLFAGLARLAGR